jgi:hypothetical protein
MDLIATVLCKRHRPRIVWSVVTIGIRSSRSSVRTWLPAFPPKIPYSCWSDTTSTPLTFKKSAARYEIRLADLELEQSVSGRARASASLRSVVNVAMPHWRGRRFPSIAILRIDFVAP